MQDIQHMQDMQNLVNLLIDFRQSIRHQSEPYAHASAVIKDPNKSCRQDR